MNRRLFLTQLSRGAALSGVLAQNHHADAAQAIVRSASANSPLKITKVKAITLQHRHYLSEEALRKRKAAAPQRPARFLPR